MCSERPPDRCLLLIRADFKTLFSPFRINKLEWPKGGFEIASNTPNICLRRYDTCALTSLKSTKVELRNTRISVAKSAIPLAPHSGIFAQSSYISDELSRVPHSCAA